MVVVAVIADSLWGSVSFNSHEVTGALSAYHATTSPAVLLLTELYTGSRKMEKIFIPATLNQCTNKQVNDESSLFYGPNNNDNKLTYVCRT